MAALKDLQETLGSLKIELAPAELSEMEKSEERENLLDAMAIAHAALGEQSRQMETLFREGGLPLDEFSSDYIALRLRYHRAHFLHDKLAALF